MMSAKYVPDHRGVQEFANSSALSSSMRGIAEQLAEEANAAGRSRYEARATTVTGGWRNESRAGAEVYEADHDFRDARDQVLVNATKQFRMRGGGARG